MMKITAMLRNVLRKFEEKVGDKGFDSWKQSTSHKKSPSYQKQKKH